MSSVNELRFGENKNNRSQKITKIYNQGDIIISYPGPSNEVCQISIKPKVYNDNIYQYQNKSKSMGKNKYTSNKNKGYKTIKMQVEEMYNQIQKEIDEMDNDEESKKNIGNILKEFFKDEELSDNTKFGPNPLKNLRDFLNRDEGKKIIKPYIPDLQTSKKNEKIINEKNYNKNKKKSNENNHEDNRQHKTKEVNLQKIIDICRENEKIINNINELYKRFLREEKIREEKERKKQILKEMKKKKSKSKEKNNNTHKQSDKMNINNQTEQINNNENLKEDEKEKNDKSDDKVGQNKEKENDEDKKNKENENNKINENDSNKKKYFYTKKDLVKIIDISKDKKYIEAKKQLIRSKENCEKTNDLILEINHKIKEDKKSFGNSDYKVIKKPRIELENRAKQIIEQVKSDINFTYENLNKDNNK